MNYKDFDPICKIKENIGVLTGDGEKYFKVIYREQLPASEDLIVDFGAIADDGVDADNEITDIEMNSGELGQYRFEPLDPIKVEVKQPMAASRFSIKNTVVRVSQRSVINNPTLSDTEFYVFENDNVYMTATNNSGAALTKSRVQFYGYRYILEELKKEPDKLAYVPATAKLD